MIDRHALALVVIKDILYISKWRHTNWLLLLIQNFIDIADHKKYKKGFEIFLFIAFADELANKATNRPNNSLLTETKNKMTSDMYIT